MCGIAGFCNPERNYRESVAYWEQILEHMRASLVRRGNDARGIFLNAHTGLAHARLSIRDITGGTQPMTRYLDGYAYTIVYNGEIYNTQELIPELSKNGYRMETTSDTEVILYAYMHYGEEFVEQLNGIFAFAIWDSRRGQLLLYRDRAGVKPLFYAYMEQTIIFGSEPKALFEHPDLTPEINRESMQEILGIGPARTGGHGIFCNVKEVLPGHYLVYSKSGLREETYWELQSYEHTDTYAQTVEKVRYLVHDAVTAQMVSDVPVCSFLSGGIDSSIVTAIASNYLQEKGQKLNTFSFDFRDNDIYFQSNSFQPERDLPYVKKMLTRYDTNHTCLECDEYQLFQALFTAVDAKDLPGMADVDASLLYFCSQVKQHNKVALTGECADEIFGGYPWFYREDLLNKDGFPWSSDVTPRMAFLSEEVIKELDLAEYSYARYQESRAKAPLLEGETGEDKSRRIIGYLNIKWFMQTLLDRMDRTSMYSGLEARVPFADHRIMEYVYNVPWHMKYQNGVEKTLLRDACADLLPPELLHRKKSPYPKTYHPDYEKLLIRSFRDILADPNAPIRPLLDRKKVETFLDAPTEYGKPWFGQLMAGPQLMAYFIQMNYWMKKYHLSV
jgi:asparagine synthase (glutamine-hydrolysing)